MAIVLTERIGNATVMIDDEYCRNLTPEQNERNRRRAQSVAWEILVNLEKQKGETNEDKEE